MNDKDEEKGMPILWDEKPRGADSIDRLVIDGWLPSNMETVHLLRSPANAEHINRSIAQFKAGKATQRDLIDE